MEKGVISYFLKYITNFLEGRNVPSPLCISQVTQISVSHSGSQLELIDSVMMSCCHVYLYYSTCYLHLFDGQSLPVFLFNVFLGISISFHLQHSNLTSGHHHSLI